MGYLVVALGNDGNCQLSIDLNDNEVIGYVKDLEEDLTNWCANNCMEEELKDGRLVVIETAGLSWKKIVPQKYKLLTTKVVG